MSAVGEEGTTLDAACTPNDSDLPAPRHINDADEDRQSDAGHEVDGNGDEVL
jgi:hypothetical protein